MFVLLTYDIDGNESSDQKRLRQVAKLCEKYGVRVQNSVFELNINQRQLLKLKSELLDIILKRDSVRIYKLHGRGKQNVDVFGRNNKIEIKDNTSFVF